MQHDRDFDCGTRAGRRSFLGVIAGTLLGLAVPLAAHGAEEEPPPGFVALFNGRDFSGWKVPEGDGGHWKVVEGVIDYDAESEAKGDKSLWSEREYGDHVLLVDWRIKEAPYINRGIPYILPDGTHARDIHGKEMRLALPDADSGVYVRGSGRPPDQHLVLADRLGRDLRHPHQPQDAPRSPRRRHPAHAGRQADRPVEPVRDHRARQDPQGRAQRQDRPPGGRVPGPADERAHRAAAPRPEAERRVGGPAQPGPVQEHLHQGTGQTDEVTSASMTLRPPGPSPIPRRADIAGLSTPFQACLRMLS